MDIEDARVTTEFGRLAVCCKGCDGTIVTYTVENVPLQDIVHDVENSDHACGEVDGD